MPNTDVQINKKNLIGVKNITEQHFCMYHQQKSHMEQNQSGPFHNTIVVVTFRKKDVPESIIIIYFDTLQPFLFYLFIVVFKKVKRFVKTLILQIIYKKIILNFF